MNSNKSFKLVCTALMTAIIAVLAQIVIPMPIGIPFTLQTFAVCLSGFLLGMKSGSSAVICYIALGACGLPVFSGMQGGIGVLITGFTGGFLWGFIPLTFLCGIGKQQYWRKHGNLLAFSFGLIGILLCHIIGVTQLSVVSSIDLISAFWVGSLPYLIKDVLSMLLAYFFSITLKKRLNKLGVKI